MAFDITEILTAYSGRNHQLHAEHINPRWSKALGIIGFDKCYERAEGAYLWDREGTRYLDTLAGYCNAVKGLDGWGAFPASLGNLIKATARRLVPQRYRLRISQTLIGWNTGSKPEIDTESREYLRDYFREGPQ